MNELEKCMAGEWYDCHDEIFLNIKIMQEIYWQNIIRLHTNKSRKRQKFCNSFLGAWERMYL